MYTKVEKIAWGVMKNEQNHRCQISKRFFNTKQGDSKNCFAKSILAVSVSIYYHKFVGYFIVVNARQIDRVTELRSPIFMRQATQKTSVSFSSHLHLEAFSPLGLRSWEKYSRDTMIIPGDAISMARFAQLVRY